MLDLPEEQDKMTAGKENMYRQIVEYTFETTIIHANHKIIYINQSGAEFMRATKAEIIGADIVAVFPEGTKETIRERIRQAVEENKVGQLIETVVYRLDGTPVEVELYCHPVMFGERKAIQSVLRDITTRKEAERKYRQVMNEVATPVVPVTDSISVLPLVGEVDEDRAEQLLELIPKRLQGQNVRHVIIDVSGIYTINTTVIEFLYEITAVMKLLGVTPVCTGLRPELAKKAVETCKDITALHTMADVKQALKLLSRQ